MQILVVFCTTNAVNVTGGYSQISNSPTDVFFRRLLYGTVSVVCRFLIFSKSKFTSVKCEGDVNNTTASPDTIVKGPSYEITALPLLIKRESTYI